MFKNFNKLIQLSIICALFTAPCSLAIADDTKPGAATSTATPTPATKPTTSAKKKAKKPTGLILKMDGTVKVLGSNKKVRTLKGKTVFFTHDTILTKDNSHAGIRFNDGTFVALGPNSALKIDDFHFTAPPKGQKYQGSPKDHAAIKLHTGVLKATMGSLAKMNKPGAFKILTPRGRIELSDPQKSPTAEVVYDKKSGLAVKALGTLTNSKGNVGLTDALYGLVSTVTGSTPITTTVVPSVYSEAWVTSTYGFYDSEYSSVDTSYSEDVMASEESLYESEEASYTSDKSDEDASDTAAVDDGDGDDDGDDSDDDDDDSDDDDDDSDDSDDGDDDSDDDDGGDDDSDDDDGGDDE